MDGIEDCSYTKDSKEIKDSQYKVELEVANQIRRITSQAIHSELIFFVGIAIVSFGVLRILACFSHKRREEKVWQTISLYWLKSNSL